MKDTVYNKNINDLYEFVFHEIKHDDVDHWIYSKILKSINLDKRYIHHESLISVVNKRLLWGLTDAKISEILDISQSSVDDWYNAGRLLIYQYMAREFY